MVYNKKKISQLLVRHAMLLKSKGYYPKNIMMVENCPKVFTLDTPLCMQKNRYKIRIGE